MDNIFTDDHNIVALRASAPVGHLAKGVDKESRSLLGVVVAEAMQIKDYRGTEYGLALDESFLTDLVNFANKHKSGILSNYGHNYNNLGRRLGRMANFTQKDGKVYADLSIFNLADKTPGLEGLGSYVLDMAAEDNELVAFSISFSYKYIYQLDSGGKELKVFYYDADRAMYVYPNPDLGATYFKFGILHSVDLVDEGAATNSLFNKQNKELESSASSQNSFIQTLKSLFGLGTASHSLIENNTKMEEIQNLKAQLEAKETEISDLKNQMEELTKKEADHSSTVSALLARVEALEKTPFAKHDLGDEESEEEEVELKAYERNPINRHWMAQKKANK